MFKLTNNYRSISSFTFSELNHGDGFKFNDNFYMKVGQSHENVNTVRLDADAGLPHLVKIKGNATVEPVNIEIIINRKGEGE